MALTVAELIGRQQAAVDETGQLDWSLVRPDFEIHDRGLLDSSVHRGREGWKRWGADWRQAFGDYSLERCGELEVDDSRVLTLHRLRARGRASGVELERTDAQLWTFSEGLLARMDYYPDYRADERSWLRPDGSRARIS